MPVAQVDDIAIFYEERGQGTPLLLLHGVGGSHANWLDHLETLGASHRAIAWDSRGRGQTPAGARPLTIKQFARDLHGLAQALRATPAVVLGTSMGGAIAIQFAVDYLEAIRALILLDTWASPHMDFVAHFQRRIDLLDRGDLDAYVAHVVPTFYGSAYTRAHPDALADYRKRLEGLDVLVMKGLCRALMEFDLQDRLGEIRVPTLVMVGGEDRLVPPFHSRSIHQRIARSRYVEIPECGHFPYLEKPAAFRKAVLSFLGDLSSHP
ncbi:MAG: alpha/beta fold hydrolase [Deltaproteobacteria bacterium]|nr:alpha/beta fold hydrolase [Deltaproteobacteria bacterium]MBI3078116.1 alpha/beta fold hydrolase [Deltaproteobacteria bacterium]